MREIRVVQSWDSMPPKVYSEGEWFSTRILAKKYRDMRDALSAIANDGMDAKQCRDAAIAALQEERS